MTITSITKLADIAQLAVASYALFDKGFSGDVLSDKASMTATQASDFLNKYDLVHHTPNDSVGFSATVFREPLAEEPPSCNATPSSRCWHVTVR